MELTWTEISNGVGAAPAWSLAGREDNVATSAGESVAALIVAASGAANNMSVNYAIDAAKPAVERRLVARFNGHQSGGILVVAGLVPQHGGQRFTYLNDYMGIYAQPSHAFSRWRSELRMEDPGTVHRFFWVTKA